MNYSIIASQTKCYFPKLRPHWLRLLPLNSQVPLAFPTSATPSACLFAPKNFHSGSKISRSKTNMERFCGSVNLMIVSDLDQTMVDHDDKENMSLLRFGALWEAYYRHDSLLIYSTGRSPVSYKSLIRKKPLVTPDVTITSVGTEIMYGESLVPDDEWVRLLNHNWNRDIVTEETAKFPELTPQEEKNQRPQKVSFYLEKDKASTVVKALSDLLENRGLDVKIIYSSGSVLDVLPKGAGKGQALEYVLEKFKAHGKVPMRTLVCGDSGNDADLFDVPDVYGVMVSNAQEELLEWHAENAKNSSNIFHATERCAAGIIQAIGIFHLGPNISPRDIQDLQKCKVDINTPSNEVVKFYLLYERWRRGEVEQSDECNQNLISVFHPSGVFVHPSGSARPMHQCMNAIVSLYGDMQGTGFWVWLDQVSCVQAGPDTWMVRFQKWESYGKVRCCCLTTVLMRSGDQGQDKFTWLHMHQTWLNGYRAEGHIAWLF